MRAASNGSAQRSAIQPYRDGRCFLDGSILDMTITASIGVAHVPAGAPDAETRLAGADRALYSAKAAGRDRVRVAQDPPPA